MDDSVVEGDLYAQCKSDIQALCDTLIDLSTKFLRDQGTFLPHGAVLTEGGEVCIVAARPHGEQERVAPAEVLPLLHDGLVNLAAERSATALAVAESVTVALDGTVPTRAIKVLVEHNRGLSVALYYPWRKKLLRGIVVGNPFAIPAEPEVKAWRNLQ